VPERTARLVLRRCKIGRIGVAFSGATAHRGYDGAMPGFGWPEIGFLLMVTLFLLGPVRLHRTGARIVDALRSARGGAARRRRSRRATPSGRSDRWS
jgi:hypothetical protein